MFNNNEQEAAKATWRTRLYVVGGVIGAVLGVVSAYLFAKEVEDPNDNNDEAPDIPPTALLGLALSIITVVRQIAETGRKKKGK
ncbi:MAG: hypothetical protein WBC91_22525 [Phototrophicaceae bacterium]